MAAAGGRTAAGATARRRVAAAGEVGELHARTHRRGEGRGGAHDRAQISVAEDILGCGEAIRPLHRPLQHPALLISCHPPPLGRYAGALVWTDADKGRVLGGSHHLTVAVVGVAASRHMKLAEETLSLLMPPPLLVVLVVLVVLVLCITLFALVVMLLARLLARLLVLLALRERILLEFQRRERRASTRKGRTAAANAVTASTVAARSERIGRGSRIPIRRGRGGGRRGERRERGS